MVYCGKPSEACGPCRAKKTRCDKVRPCCGQCRRTKTQCGGYRDTSDTLFRDQTREVASKVIASQAGASSSRIGKTPPTSPRRTVLAGTSRQSPSIPSAISFQLDEFATKSFYDHFVANGMAPGQDCMGLVPDAYLQASANSSLSELTIALGLLSHPETREDEAMAQLARKKYASALTMTNEALGDPTRRTSDDTLMTVILLAIYELVTGIAPAALESWTAHVNGSINLLLLRGVNQFKSRAGLAMFIHMRTRIFVSCLQRCIAVPDELMQLSRASYPYLNEEETAQTNLAEVVSEFCRLRADIAAGVIKDPSQVGARLFEVDQAQIGWANNLPAEFQATRVQVPKSEFTYEEHYDTYCSRFVASMMHSHASTRVVINQYMKRIMALEMEQRGDDPYIRANMETVNDTILKTSKQVCASVPFVMGFKVPTEGQEGNKLNMYGSSNLAWILFPIISSDSNPERMRDWCYNQLIRVSELSGMKQARTIADLAKARVNVSELFGNMKK